MPTFFSDWNKFYLTIADELFDVRQFYIKQYAIDQPFLLTLEALIPADIVNDFLKIGLKASLTIVEEAKPLFFHGQIIAIHLNTTIKPPRGLCLFNISIGCDIWQKMQTLACQSYHSTNLQTFLDRFASDLALLPSQFNIKNIPQAFKALRMVKHKSWSYFLLTELEQANSHIQTCFDKEQSSLIISSKLDDFNYQNQVRLLSEVLQSQMVMTQNNTCFNVRKKRRVGEPATLLQFYSEDPYAFPGEQIQIIGSEQVYCIWSVEMSGFQHFSFEADSVADKGRPVITSQVMAYQAKPQPIQKINIKNKTCAIYTGRIEAKNAKEQYAYRTTEGHYRARYDFEEQIESRQTPGIKKFVTARAKALSQIRQNTLMPAKNNAGVDLPLHDGTEVLLTMNANNEEPAFILGALNNSQSQAISGVSNHMLNIFKSWAGNQLQFIDSHNKQSLLLSTYQQQHYLSFDYQTGSIQLKTQQGQIIVFASESISFKAKQQVRQLIKSSSQEVIKGDWTLNILQEDLHLNIKKNMYYKVGNIYKLEMLQISFDSKDKVQLTAQKLISIKTAQLKLEATHGQVKLSAKTIQIKANKLLANTDKANLTLEHDIMNLQAERAMVKAKMITHCAKNNIIGGCPRARAPASFWHNRC